MAQEAEEKWVVARVLRGQMLDDSNVHVPLGTEWEGRGGRPVLLWSKGSCDFKPSRESTVPRISESPVCLELT